MLLSKVKKRERKGCSLKGGEGLREIGYILLLYCVEEEKELEEIEVERIAEEIRAPLPVVEEYFKNIVQ